MVTYAYPFLPLLGCKSNFRGKQVNILISKTILFIQQNMFQSIPTSSSVAKNIIKTVNILNLHVS